MKYEEIFGNVKKHQCYCSIQVIINELYFSTVKEAEQSRGDQYNQVLAEFLIVIR